MSKAHNEGRLNKKAIPYCSFISFPILYSLLAFPSYPRSISLSHTHTHTLSLFHPMSPLCASLFFCRSLSLFVCVSLSFCFSFNTSLYPSLYATPCLHHSLLFLRLLQYLVSHTLGGHIVDYLIILSSSDPV